MGHISDNIDFTHFNFHFTTLKASLVVNSLLNVVCTFSSTLSKKIVGKFVSKNVKDFYLFGGYIDRIIFNIVANSNGGGMVDTGHFISHSSFIQRLWRGVTSFLFLPPKVLVFFIIICLGKSLSGRVLKLMQGNYYPQPVNKPG